MKVGENWANAKGPKPGSTKSISQRKAISEGYEAAKSERRVMTFQDDGKTGETSAPGLTSKPSMRR